MAWFTLNCTDNLDHCYMLGWVLFFIFPIIVGCSNLMFLPNQIRYSTPDDFGLDYEDIFLRIPENIRLHAWFLPSKVDAKGTVFFLHGNAQNISAHIYSIYWLPENGYHVFMIDYRGYGASTGTPTVQGVLDDISTGFAWLVQNQQVQKGPIFLLGQSLGASLGIYFVGTHSNEKKQLAGVIADAAFSSFRSIAREKLDSFWLTWPLQYPLSLLMPDDFDPQDVIQNISPVPVLIMHSKDDEIVPSTHGQILYELAGKPKFFVQTRNGHIATFKYSEYREAALKFMAAFD